LILLDIGLPTLNGIEVARQIRKLSPQTKILFVTQESSADVIKEALSLGAMGYVSSSAFWTASNPSDTTQMTCNSDLSRIIEQTNRRKGSKILYHKNAD